MNELELSVLAGNICMVWNKYSSWNQMQGLELNVMLELNVQVVITSTSWYYKYGMGLHMSVGIKCMSWK